MVRRGTVIVTVLVLALFGLSAAWAEGQGTPTPGVSPVASPVASPGATPMAGAGDVEKGKAISAQCMACHSVDGRTVVGPTWKGLYGSEVELQDGTKVKADDAYLHQSIVDPMSQIVKGFPPSMPPYGKTLTEQQIQDLIAYIRALK